MDTDFTDIIRRIQFLDKKEKLHILNILKQDAGADFTKNTYGYFFNLSHVSEDTLNKIIRCVDLIDTNRDIIKEMDRRRYEMLDYYKSVIEEKLTQSIQHKRERYIQSIQLQEIPTGIELSITRIPRFKKRIQTGETDPDVLIKAHAKNLSQFKKNSVYYRVLSKIRSSRMQKNSFRKQKQKDYSEVHDAEPELDAENEAPEPEIDDHALDDHDALDDDHHSIDGSQSDHFEDPDADPDIHQPSEDPHEDDDVVSQSHDSDGSDHEDSHYDSEDDSPSVENSSGFTHILVLKNKKNPSTSVSQESKRNLAFYKRLLHSKGFQFHENNSCRLVREPYLV